MNLSTSLKFLCSLALVAVFAVSVQAQKITINAPDNLAGTVMEGIPASFGAPITCATDITGMLVLANDGTDTPTEACDTTAQLNDMTGMIGVIDRGSCNFSLKVYNAQQAGAVAVIVCNNVDGDAIAMGAGDFGDLVTIPSLMLRKDQCRDIRAELANGVPVNLNITRSLDSFGEGSNILWGANEGEGDFSGGLNGWTTVNYTPCAADTLEGGYPLFQWTAEGDAPNGAYGGGLINAPSACNGAIKFESDFYDNSGIAGNFGAGPCAAVQSGALISPAIDISSLDVAGLTLEFYQTMRQFQSQFFVGWSTDGGMTWDSTEINTATPVNESLENGSLRVNMPGAEQGETLHLKFTMVGNYYYWLLDDVRVVEREANNMSVSPDWYAIAPNAIYPETQIEPIPFLADVLNKGAVAQENVNLNAAVLEYNTDNVLFSTDLDYGSITSDSLAENIPFAETYTPTAPGIYTGLYTVSADSTDFDPTDNQLSYFFIVENGGTFVAEPTFAKEWTSTPTNAYRPDDAEWGEGEAHSWAIGNHYHNVNAGDYARSLSFDLAPDNAAGQFITFTLYKWEDANEDAIAQPEERTSVAATFYEVTGEEIYDDATLVTIPFPDIENGDEPVLLEANTDYIIMMEYFAPDAETNFYLSVNDADFPYGASSYVSELVGAPRYSYLAGAGADLTTVAYETFGLFGDVAPVMRLAVGADPTTVAVEELEVSGKITLSPNPAATTLNVQFDLEERLQEVTVKVVDATGRTLISNQYNSLQAETLNYNVSNLASGLYFLQIETVEGVKTERFTVAK